MVICIIVMALGIIGNLMVIISTLTLTLIPNLYIYEWAFLKKKVLR